MVLKVEMRVNPDAKETDTTESQQLTQIQFSKVQQASTSNISEMESSGHQLLPFLWQAVRDGMHGWSCPPRNQDPAEATTAVVTTESTSGALLEATAAESSNTLVQKCQIKVARYLGSQQETPRSAVFTTSQGTSSDKGSTAATSNGTTRTTRATTRAAAALTSTTNQGQRAAESRGSYSNKKIHTYDLPSDARRAAAFHSVLWAGSAKITASKVQQHSRTASANHLP